MRLTLNDLPTVAFAAFAALMIYGSITMDPSFSGSNQHRWVPLGVSIFVLVLSISVFALERLNPNAVGEEGSIEASSFIYRVLPMLVLMALYSQGKTWLGYELATLVVGICVFRLFGNSFLKSALHSVIATLLLYTVFFKLLKLYNPSGTLLDLPPLF